MNCLLVAVLAAAFAAPASAEPASDDTLLREFLWEELTRLPKDLRPVVGLALSAGSMRALSHVGVIQVLDRAGFPLDVVSGTSMGAIIGSHYAAGASRQELWETYRRAHFGMGTDVNAIRLWRLLITDSLMSTKKMEDLIRKRLGDLTFGQLPKPFACVAMDLTTGEKIIFREGSLAPAVRASITLPGLFKPVEYRHRYLVDGGVVDYIPVDAARLLGAEWVVVSVAEPDYTRSSPRSVLAAMEQVIDIRGAILSQEQRRQADFVIEPQVGDVDLFDSHRSLEAMQKGVTAARAKLHPAQEKLILFSLPRMVRP